MDRDRRMPVPGKAKLALLGPLLRTACPSSSRGDEVEEGREDPTFVEFLLVILPLTSITNYCTPH